MTDAELKADFLKFAKVDRQGIFHPGICDECGKFSEDLAPWEETQPPICIDCCWEKLRAMGELMRVGFE